MSATGLQVFDDTVHKTNVWLNEVMEEIGPDRQRAYQAMRAVLHTLRDHLPPEEAVHLSAQLPMLVRGLYFEGWSPGAPDDRDNSRDAFLKEVSARMDQVAPINAEEATKAVFGVIDRHVTPGETKDVRQNLKEDVRTVWP